MPSLQYTADLLTTTISNYKRLHFADISTKIQKFVVMPRLMKKNKVEFDGGDDFRWDLMTNENGSFRMIGLYARDNVDVPDVMIQGVVPFRNSTWNWAIDQIEIAKNSGSAVKIVDLAQTRRISAFISATKGMERQAWRAPASSSDTENAYGIPYWVVKSATAATYANNDGFNGLAPSGWSTVAGINPTTYDNWRNYADTYANITPEDLIVKWRRMATKIDFSAPVDNMPLLGSGEDMAYYTNYAVLGSLEVLLTAQNENLGKDLASMDGATMFRRVPVMYVPFLEDDTTGPVYAIDWGQFKIAGLKGRWLVETVIPVVHGQHNTAQTHTDISWNMFCYNRRRCGVLSTGTTMPA